MRMGESTSSLNIGSLSKVETPSSGMGETVKGKEKLAGREVSLQKNASSETKMTNVVKQQFSMLNQMSIPKEKIVHAKEIKTSEKSGTESGSSLEQKTGIKKTITVQHNRLQSMQNPKHSYSPPRPPISEVNNKNERNTSSMV